MLVNEYRLEIQFKKVQKIRNINNIPTVGSRPLECMQRTDFTWSLSIKDFRPLGIEIELLIDHITVGVIK